jgi:GxxExxY protein
MADNYKHSDITRLIIKTFFNVYNQLGYGFLEKVYENALLIELRKFGLECVAQYPIEVFYDCSKVGFYIADIVVNNCVIIEIKAAEAICEEHEAQLVNYLRATDIEVGLLLNFGKKADFKRKVFSDEYKNLNKSSLS